MKIDRPYYFLCLLSHLIVSRGMQHRDPIFHQTIQGNLQAIKEFLQKTNNVNFIDRSTGQTLLHYAAKYNQIEVVRYLLENGASVDGKALHNCPLWDACKLSLYDIAAILLEYEADINREDLLGHTALTRAVSANNAPLTKLLLQYGADHTAVDKLKRDALIIAQENKFDEIIALLQPDNVKDLQEKHRIYPREARLKRIQLLNTERKEIETARLLNFLALSKNLQSIELFIQMKINK